jgi:hypothetical protein
MRLDILVARPEHIFATDLPKFSGSPIYGMDTLAMEDAVNRDIENRVRENKRSPVENRAEVMPGEIICPDNIIRRTTTREVTGKHEALMSNSLSMWCPRGQSVDDAGEPIESPVELLCVNIDEARQASKEGKIVKWRTAGELSEVIA